MAKFASLVDRSAATIWLDIRDLSRCAQRSPDRCPRTARRVKPARIYEPYDDNGEHGWPRKSEAEAPFFEKGGHFLTQQPARLRSRLGRLVSEKMPSKILLLL